MNWLYRICGSSFTLSVALVLVFAVSLSACECRDGETCPNNTTCDGGQCPTDCAGITWVCAAGYECNEYAECVEPNDCENNDDCPTGYACFQDTFSCSTNDSNGCVSRCCHDYDCWAGYQCNDDGTCSPAR